jgi:PAS domain S-box-containing protein
MKLSLRGKIVPLLVIALVVLLSCGWLSYFSTSKFIETSDLVAHTYQILAELQATDANVKDAEISQRNYLLTNLQSYLQPYNEARANELANIQNLRELTSDNSRQQTRLNHLETLINEHRKFIDEVLAVRNQQGTAAAAQFLRTGQGQQILDQIRQVIAEMKDEETNLLQGRTADADASSQQTILLFWVLITIVATLFVLIYFLLNRDINQRQRSEQALRQSENQLRLITDNMPAQISFVDSKQNFRFVNKPVEEWFGQPGEQIVGKHIKETLGEKLYTTMESYIARALAGEEVIYEHCRPAINGEDHIFHVAYLPQWSEDKKIEAVRQLGLYWLVLNEMPPSIKFKG